MKLLINIAELDNYKSRDKLPIECELCHNIFYRPKNDIQWALKSPERNYLRLCSKKCRNTFNDHRQSFPCHFCKKITKHKQRQIKTSKFLFCSCSCSTKYWNVHKTWGSNRSKLELWLEKQLTKKYSNLEIIYNDRKTINAELDIYIPSLKLAFELNGIFHYEPIYGKEQLDKTQTNDNRKFHACLEHSISLCVMDITSMKYFKEEKANTFLKIIIDIINKKMEDSTGVDPDAI